MSIATNEAITRQDIIDRFNLRIKTWVGSNVNILPTTTWTGSYRVWDGTHGWQGQSTDPNHTLAYTVVRTLNTTAQAIAQNSIANGGATNSTLTATTLPDESVVETNFSAAIGIENKSGHVAKVMKDFLRYYSKIHKTRFQNAGNLAPAGWGGTSLIGITNGTTIAETAATQMNADIDTWLINNKMKTGSTFNPTQFITFIDACRTIWYNRCINGDVQETFRFNYCHNNCHTNVTCYNSRGRR